MTNNDFDELDDDVFDDADELIIEAYCMSCRQTTAMASRKPVTPHPLTLKNQSSSEAQQKLHALATKGREPKVKAVPARKAAVKAPEEIIPLDKEEMAAF